MTSVSASRTPPVVVLDDDPTGVQTLAGIRVLLAWDAERIGSALEGRRAVHLVTNTRALPSERVEGFVADAARAALDGVPEAAIVLRGDSTLRGHVLEEYLGVRSVVAPDTWPVLLLAPALPSAGRITVGGMHLFERDGMRTPLHETEYARDGVFAYTSSRLLEWAEERSGGLFRADNGRELGLSELHEGGAAVVADALQALATTGRPCALVPDAVTVGDLEAIAEGSRLAVASGAEVVVRCAPTFAGVLAGTTATGLVPLPAATGGLLVVCGSYVEQTRRQVERLLEQHPGSLAEADVLALASDDPSTEITKLARNVSELLSHDALAVLATPTARPPETLSLAAGGRIAANLARVLARLEVRPEVVVAKGGITSAVTLREGVGADEAEVVGPVVPGVSRWSTTWRDGSPVAYLVVPGNVGEEDLLQRLVAEILRRSAHADAVP
jgi:uncharacterized protein YgbK (DUF1537 family)